MSHSLLMHSQHLELAKGRTVGLRFRDVRVPRGATVDKASLELLAASLSDEPLEVLVVAEAADSSERFVATGDCEQGGASGDAAVLAGDCEGAIPFGCQHWPTSLTPPCACRASRSHAHQRLRPLF